MYRKQSQKLFLCSILFLCQLWSFWICAQYLYLVHCSLTTCIKSFGRKSTTKAVHQTLWYAYIHILSHGDRSYTNGPRPGQLNVAVLFYVQVCITYTGPSYYNLERIVFLQTKMKYKIGYHTLDQFLILLHRYNPLKPTTKNKSCNPLNTMMLRLTHTLP